MPNNISDKRFRLKQLGKLIPQKKDQASLLQKELSALMKEEANIVKGLNRKVKDPMVSDHAVIRYMERKYNINIQDIRKEILTDTVREAIEVGAVSVSVNGVKLKIVNKVITTVI